MLIEYSFTVYLTEYAIWHLISTKEDCLDVYLTIPSSARINAVFSSSVKQFSQIVCLLLWFYIPLFLKLMQLFVLNLCRELKIQDVQTH